MPYYYKHNYWQPQSKVLTEVELFSIFPFATTLFTLQNPQGFIQGDVCLACGCPELIPDTIRCSLGRTLNHRSEQPSHQQTEHKNIQLAHGHH